MHKALSYFLVLEHSVSSQLFIVSVVKHSLSHDVPEMIHGIVQSHLYLAEETNLQISPAQRNLEVPEDVLSIP